MTEYQRIVAQERRVMRRVRLAWWAAVIVLLACVAALYFWR